MRVENLAKHVGKYLALVDMSKSDLKAVTKLARERGVRYEEIVRRMGEIKRADVTACTVLLVFPCFRFLTAWKATHATSRRAHCF